MQFTLIKGRFYLVGYSPDGDSLKFRADNPALWNTFVTENRRALDDNLAEEDGVIMLRLQGIDAFETHYSPEAPPPPKDLKVGSAASVPKPEAGTYKQPVRIAQEATNALMRLFGVQAAKWKTWGKTSYLDSVTVKRGKALVEIGDKGADAFPGYIVTNDAERNGRPISWVFPGETDLTDGDILTTAGLVKIVTKSANYKLLGQGLVYPYFFMTLPGKLRQKMASAAQSAQKKAARTLEKYPDRQFPEDQPNLWLYDQTINGIEIEELKQITDTYGLYPYLFRRIIKHWYRTQMERYWEALRGGKAAAAYDLRVDFARFFDGQNPYVFVVSDQDFVRLSDILVVEGRRLILKKHPYDIVFLS